MYWCIHAYMFVCIYNFIKTCIHVHTYISINSNLSSKQNFISRQRDHIFNKQTEHILYRATLQCRVNTHQAESHHATLRSWVCCQQFSKISSTVIIHGKFSCELRFEKFSHQAESRRANHTSLMSVLPTILKRQFYGYFAHQICPKISFTITWCSSFSSRRRWRISTRWYQSNWDPRLKFSKTALY